MKNRIGEALAKAAQKRKAGPVTKGIRAVWQLISKNFGLKLLSLLVAILLWNYVITTNTSITRTKTVTGLTGYVDGQSVPSSAYGLALVEDPAAQLSNVSVMIEVSQSDFSNVTADNVQVTLDLSNARRTGVQEIPLKATTAYGRIVRIIPSKVSVEMEALDSRVIPVNVQTVGTAEQNYWYRVNRLNPQSLSIKGPASVVQSIASALVDVDITGTRERFTSAEQYVLKDGEGNEIPQAMLERSASSISVSVDVYPTKDIPIDSEMDRLISGQPAVGYVVESVSIQPAAVTVAAEQELLDSIDSLHIDPISVEGASQSFSARAEVSTLSSFKSVSAEQVYVNVTIAEETVGAWIEDVRISYVNKGEGLTLVEPQNAVRVYITGPRSAVQKLREAGFVATVDLTGLDAGEYLLGMSFPDAYDDIEFTPENVEIKVQLNQ